MSRSYKSFKNNIIDSYINNFGNQYFFLGYSPNTPEVNSIGAERDGRASITFAYTLLGSVSSKNTNVAKVIKRYDWSSRTAYDVYNPNDNLRNKIYYVRNSQNNVYVCLENMTLGTSTGSTNNSTIEPTGKSSKPITLKDGYTWKYIYTIDGELEDFIKTVNGVDYMPIKTISQSDVRRNGGADKSQYKSEQGFSGRIISASIDLSETITFGTDTPSIRVVGDGSKTASVALSVNKGVVNGISVTNGGRGYNFANIKVDTTPTSHTASEIESKISLFISPENKNVSVQPAHSYFYIDKLMYSVKIDTSNLDNVMKQRKFNVYGIAKDFMLNGAFNQVAGSEVRTDTRKGYRLSQKFELHHDGAESLSLPDFNFASGSASAFVGGGIEDYTDSTISGIVTHYRRPVGYTGNERAELEVSYISGTGGFKNSNRIRLEGESGWANINGNLLSSSFEESQIKKNTGEVLYINYLDDDLIVSNSQSANLVFLQEI